MRSKGFTLIEIIMVVSLVGILAAFAIPNLIDFRDEARTAVTKDRLNEFRIAISGDPRSSIGGTIQRRGFYRDVGSFPTSLDNLVTQGSYPSYNPLTRNGWNGPYVDSTISNWNKDGWDQTITYELGNRILRSCGPNKICSDGDDITVTF